MQNILTEKKYKCLNTFVLKLIAIISMTLDHVGAVVGTKRIDGALYLSGILDIDTYNILRGIGRIAFPVFCYLIVEGYYHTRNVWKYILRLFVFALISQIPFSLGNAKTLFDFSSLNVFFTLSMGLICVFILDKCIEQFKTADNFQIQRSVGKGILSFLSIAAIIFLSVLLHTDYSIFGILLILIFYIFRDSPVKIFIAMLLDILLFQGNNELPAMFALIPIFLHNGKKGPSAKYAFYAYYPIHLTVLYVIYKLLVQ